MGRYLGLAAAAVLTAVLAMAAGAQELAPLRTQEVAPLIVTPAGVLFLSPAGEPFRGGTDMTKSMKIWFDQADANHDGALTYDEFLADHMRFFRLMEQHGKDNIDMFDVARYEQDIAPELIAAYEHTGTGRPGPKGANVAKTGLFNLGAPLSDRQGAAAFGLLNEAEPIRIADLDFDFHVTAEEWTAQAKKRFRELDTRGDGRITFDELRLPPDALDDALPVDRCFLRACPER